MASTDRSDLIKTGEKSRLIPVVADMSREERAVSPLLAAFSIIPAFAHSLLLEVGGPTNQRATIRSFSQIVFKGTPTDKKLRPDGLLEVDSGRKVWRALIEAKIGSAQLTADQLEPYLDLAKQFGVDAVITISNEFSTLPTHHPVTVNKLKLRNVELYHFSWLAILTKARLLSDDTSISDPEQAFILKELIRYLSHESSGVCEMTRLGKEWKEICAKTQTGTPIAKADSGATAVVAQWHQLTRYLALELSAAIGKSVNVWLTRAHAKDPAQRLAQECAQFASQPILHVEFDIPNATSRLTMEADFLRRSLRFSISLNTPQDKARPPAAVNWATRQLASLPAASDTLIRVHWPGRSADTVAQLSEATADPKTVVPDDKKDLPSGFAIQRVVDLAARFKGSSTFVEDARRELPRFYKDVVQNVANWTPRAPKYKESISDDVDVGERADAIPIDSVEAEETSSAVLEPSTANQGD